MIFEKFESRIVDILTWVARINLILSLIVIVIGLLCLFGGCMLSSSYDSAIAGASGFVVMLYGVLMTIGACFLYGIVFVVQAAVVYLKNNGYFPEDEKYEVTTVE